MKNNPFLSDALVKPFILDESDVPEESKDANLQYILNLTDTVVDVRKNNKFSIHGINSGSTWADILKSFGGVGVESVCANKSQIACFFMKKCELLNGKCSGNFFFFKEQGKVILVEIYTHFLNGHIDVMKHCEDYFELLRSPLPHAQLIIPTPE
ncbi:MAG: hypothetical protein WCJ51_02780 [Candidatus Moraniibacteriota bacterium]